MVKAFYKKDIPDTHDYVYDLNLDSKKSGAERFEENAKLCLKAQSLYNRKDIQVHGTRILSHKPIRSPLLKQDKRFWGPKRQKKILDLFQSSDDVYRNVTGWRLSEEEIIDGGNMASAFETLERRDMYVGAICMSEDIFHQFVWNKGAVAIDLREAGVCFGAWVATLWGAPILVSDKVGDAAVLVPTSRKKEECFALFSNVLKEFRRND